jgi:hypothetical protein
VGTTGQVVGLSWRCIIRVRSLPRPVDAKRGTYCINKTNIKLRPISAQLPRFLFVKARPPDSRLLGPAHGADGPAWSGDELGGQVASRSPGGHTRRLSSRAENFFPRTPCARSLDVAPLWDNRYQEKEGAETLAITELPIEAEEPDQVHPGGNRKRVNPRDAEWHYVTGRLAEALECLEEGHFLGLEARGDTPYLPYYVQFAANGDDGFLVEAVSNRFLSGWERLDATAEGRLRRLGWRPPTDIGEGPPNWWRSYPAGAPATDMAGLAVATLRKVFEVPRPVALVYRAFSRDGEEILLPTLGIEHHKRRPPLDDRVDAALQEHLEVDEVTRDEDGDRPVRSGEAMVFVRVVRDPGFVAVFSPALTGVTRTTALVKAVNDINISIRGARAAVTDNAVLIAAEVYDQPALESAVINAFKAVSFLANSCAAQLRPRFGGNTFFGEPAPTVEDDPEPATGLYL